MNARTWLKLRLYRRKMYRAVFLGEDGKPSEAGELVLADLAKFCHVNDSAAQVSPVMRTVDPHATMIAEGKREVFRRITQYLNVSEAQIFALLERENGRSNH